MPPVLHYIEKSFFIIRNLSLLGTLYFLRIQFNYYDPNHISDIDMRHKWEHLKRSLLCPYLENSEVPTYSNTCNETVVIWAATKRRN